MQVKWHGSMHAGDGGGGSVSLLCQSLAPLSPLSMAPRPASMPPHRTVADSSESPDKESHPGHPEHLSCAERRSPIRTRHLHSVRPRQQWGNTSATVTKEHVHVQRAVTPGVTLPTLILLGSSSRIASGEKVSELLLHGYSNPPPHRYSKHWFTSRHSM